jgi:hypothetical protein
VDDMKEEKVKVLDCDIEEQQCKFYALYRQNDELYDELQHLKIQLQDAETALEQMPTHFAKCTCPACEYFGKYYARK